MRNISNSEVTTWLTCRRMYVFAFIRNLTPKVTPKPLARGTLGHEAFSRYITLRLEGLSHEAALAGSMKVFEEAISQGATIDIVMETQFLYTRYMDFHQGWPEWELLGTEEKLEVKINDDEVMVIRYDLMVKDKKSGHILIGDFKFSYDFWRPLEHDTNAQMPKYITVLQANGVNVRGGFLEEVRTRPLGAEKASDARNLWRRTLYYPSTAKRRNMMRQHLLASAEITEFRRLSPEEQDLKAIPVFNKHGACKYCNFIELCNSMNDGKDIEYDIETGYVQNTYGYNFGDNVETENWKDHL